METITPPKFIPVDRHPRRIGTRFLKHSPKPLTIGYLHVGPKAHGVTRYGMLLDEAARTHLVENVRSRHIERLGDGSSARRSIRQALQELGPSDVIHLQYNERIWGGAWRALGRLLTFNQQNHGAWVVTVHDVRDGYSLRAILARLWEERRTPDGRLTSAAPPTGETEDRPWVFPSNVVSSARKAVRYLAREVGNALATWFVTRAADRVIVCTQEEARRIDAISGRTPVSVIPHFVEERPGRPPATQAKQHVDLEGRRVVSVLGYIHRRKGHDRVVEALPHLPDDVVAVFIGRAGRNSPEYAQSLRIRAAELGVTDRVRFTGYVDEETLDCYLAATDLALCPFREASASGSLSTWIASATPILATDLPLFDEYASAAPEAITRVRSADPHILAGAIRSALKQTDDAPSGSLETLRDRLSLRRTIDAHLVAYDAARRGAHAVTFGGGGPFAEAG